MLDLKYIKNNLDLVKKGMAKRRANIDFSSLLDSYAKRKELLLEIETLRHKRNVVSDDIAKMKKSGQDASHTIEEMKTVSASIKNLDKELSATQQVIKEFLISIPNLPHKDVPEGMDDTENRFAGYDNSYRVLQSFFPSSGETMRAFAAHRSGLPCEKMAAAFRLFS